jgi:eukaryotic-like serine/threonine-protein kinase
MTAAVATGALVDEFLVGELIHKSAMGSTYRVSRSDLSEPLVMKVPHFVPGDGGEGLVGFETEATILPTLQGPHVPSFVAQGDLSRLPYIVVEWVPGQTLEARLEQGRISPSELAKLGAAMADALFSVHQQSVLHLDLKPANIMLRPDGVVVLIDFGLAHHSRYPDLLAEETRYRAGSAPYVSPEQLLGARDDRRSDIFALGVTLYEALTGKLPFGEPDTDVRNRFWLDPDPPSACVPDVPPWLQEIVLRCIEPRAELRYQSAAHLAFDLRHPEQVVLTERATRVRRSGLLTQMRRFFRARSEYGRRLKSPQPLVNESPIVLVAVDTEHLEDERLPAIYAAVERFLTHRSEYRVLCLAIIPPSASAHEHLVRLRHWAEPLRLPVERLTLHAVESSSPAEAIVQLASHNNVDLVILGAPSGGSRAWSLSVASTVTAKVRASVHVVRVGKA